MNKIIFISNRLPVTVTRTEQGLEYHKSIGGLATGLKSYHEKGDGLWVGWPGIPADDLTDSEKKEIKETLINEYKCVPVFLTQEDIDKYYYGFSNETIWPLFHYFTNMTVYNRDNWESYVKVNQLFMEAVNAYIDSETMIWVHDYQLMLLPKMIKDEHYETKIGFFLHIPFPSFEIFRLMITRQELLEGVLGSDLIGFHTFDYVRHFLSSTRRILGLENEMNTIYHEERVIKVDVFPMGVDYDWFSRKIDSPEYNAQVKEIEDNLGDDVRMILSIDRLDYTKGIKERIKSYGMLLEKYPEYIGKVRLNLIVAPSRVEVKTYSDLLHEIEILVSEVNGKYGTFSWMPVWFYFQSFPQENLIAFYRHADVLLVTPLRDGMNLVVKEYIAARTDLKGMVVISETTGAASELGETVIVNSNDINAIADGLHTALEMPESEKMDINKVIHKRVQRYTVEFWAEHFIETLQSTEDEIFKTISGVNLLPKVKDLKKDYLNADKRLIFLDYDGTLVGFKSIPIKAKPDKALLEMIKTLAADEKNTVVIISGRDHYTLGEWFDGINVNLIASHGLWLKENGYEWSLKVNMDNAWKETIAPMLDMFSDRMPGSIVEEKDYSLAFHYRQCEPSLVEIKLAEVKEAIGAMIASKNLEIKAGNKVIEIKDASINKGLGADIFLPRGSYDFIMSIGDDKTDEDLFERLPEDAYSIKVGIDDTVANYRLKSHTDVRKLLKALIESDKA